MGRITIFTQDKCEQSQSLREYLVDNDVPFHDISLTKHPDRRLDMITLSSDLSTPQIFFNSLHIGALKELQNLFDVYTKEGTSSSSSSSPTHSHYSNDKSTLSSTDEEKVTDNDCKPSSPSSSSSNNIILERLAQTVLNQSPPNHEPKLRLPSQKNERYHQKLQIEYESWVERLKVNEYFTIRHDESGEVNLSIVDVIRTLLEKVPQQTHYEFPMALHKVHTKCFRGKDLIPILKKEYTFLTSSKKGTNIDNTDEDALAFAQTLLDLGILHHVIHSKKKRSNVKELQCNFDEATTTERIQFDVGGIFRVQALHAPHILNKYRLWSKLCIIDGHDPQPLTTLSQLSQMLNAVIEKGVNSDRSMIDYESIRNDPDFHEFEQMTCLLQLTNLDTMLEKAKLAFFINLYNLMVKHAIIVGQYSPTKSTFYTKTYYMIGEYAFNLDDIYHGILRCNAKHPKTNKVIFPESDKRNYFKCSSLNPRIHFALNSNYLSSEENSGGNVKIMMDTYEYHREAVNGELFLVAHQRCKADDRIIVDDHKDVLNLPNFIKIHLHDFISHWNGVDNEFPVVMSKFLIGEKREILEQMIRKTNNRESKKRIAVIFGDSNNAMSLHSGLGCLPFSCKAIVKGNKLGAFPQAFPEDELQLLDEDYYQYFDPDITSADFLDDSFSQSSSDVRDVYMSSAWDNFSNGESSWSLSLKSMESWEKHNSNQFYTTPNHPSEPQLKDTISMKFPSTPKNRNDGSSQSPSTVKTCSTTRDSPSSNGHNDSFETIMTSDDLVLPDFFAQDDLSFDATTTNDDNDGDLSEIESEGGSRCSGPPKAKRVVENTSLFANNIIEEEDNANSTKEIINLFFPKAFNDDENDKEDGESKSDAFTNDDVGGGKPYITHLDKGMSFFSRALKHDVSCSSIGSSSRDCSSLISRDTQFEKLFNSSMASI